MQCKNSRVPTVRQREWLDHLTAWREQGGTLKAYAQEKGLSAKGLYAARSTLERNGHWHDADSKRASSPFVAVRIAKRASVCRVVLPNTVIVEVPLDAELGECVQLLRAAASLP